VNQQERLKVKWNKLWQTPERAAFVVMSLLAIVILWWGLITTGEWDPELGLVLCAGQAIFFLVMLFAKGKRGD